MALLLLPSPSLSSRKPAACRRPPMALLLLQGLLVSLLIRAHPSGFSAEKYKILIEEGSDWHCCCCRVRC